MEKEVNDSSNIRILCVVEFLVKQLHGRSIVVYFFLRTDGEGVVDVITSLRTFHRSLSSLRTNTKRRVPTVSLRLMIRQLSVVLDIPCLYV